MKLVIAEKPSVAQSLARVIGANKRQEGYLEGNGYLVSWCVGHLVELSAPERYDERFAKWRLEDLPILPERFLYEVSAGTSKQYQILKGLMERPDVASLVCATDAGREGELIFRLVYNQCRCKKPFERLWISSMEDAAIREGFEKLKPGTAYDALYGNERHPAFFLPVRPDTGGRSCHDADPCHGGDAGCPDRSIQTGTLLDRTDHGRWDHSNQPPLSAKGSC